MTLSNYSPVEHDESSSFNEVFAIKTEENGVTSRARLVAVTLFATCVILLFADQNLMAPNLSAIAEEFGFNDEERDRKLGGQIALAFFVMGAPASLMIGCLGDQCNRTALFALTVGLGETACLLTYFSSGFTQLFACRAVTGLSLGGAIPLIYSILGDLFAADERHAVNAVVSIGSGCGIAIGQGIAGFVGPTYGWRLPFLLVSIPALVCALAVLCFVRDPERGGMEAAVRAQKKVETGDPANRDIIETEGSIEMLELPRRRSSSNEAPGQNLDELQVSDETRIPVDCIRREVEERNNVLDHDWYAHLRTFRMLITTPTVLLMLLQGAPGCVPWGIVNTYLNDFLSKNRGMTVEGATATVLFFGFGNFFGLVIGGAGGRFLYRVDRRYPSILAGIAAFVACVPFWALLNLVDASSPLWFIVFVTVVAGMGSGATGPIVKAILQNVTLPNTRGQAFALFNMFDDFGKGLGPFLVSFLITAFKSRATAFNFGTIGWAVCGMFNLAVFFTVNADESRIQQILIQEMQGKERLVVPVD